MSDLHQQIWEFVYDLLPEEEAEEMRERISSDPDVARAYSEIKLQTEMISRASRFDADQIAWSRPTDVASTRQAADPVQPAAAAPWGQTANWLVGVAAAGLLCVMCWPLFVSDQRPERSVARAPTAGRVAPAVTAVRTVLVGPAKLNAESVNTFSIRTTTAAREPVETVVASRFYDVQGELAYTATSRTDSSGQLLVELPSEHAAQAVRVEVAAENSLDFLSRSLEVSNAKHVTYLRLDRPLYRPGDAVNYRSVTLSRLGLQPDAATNVHFFVTDPEGQTLGQSEQTGVTTEGVGAGEFNIPADAAEGSYSVVVQSPEESFYEQWREFDVRRYRAPRFKAKLELAKDSYTTGEMVEAEFLAESPSGRAMANVELKAEARFGEQEPVVSETKTDSQGAATLSFRVPASLKTNRGSLSVTIRDADGDETISEDVPINVGKVNVDFYPEGGRLVAGLPNRMYFYGRDPQGKPVHVEGSITGASGGSVAEVATIHEGRGVVSFTPQAGVSYQLTVRKPVGTAKSFALPPVNTGQELVMQTGPGIFSTGEPIEVRIDTKSPQTPLVVVGYCRDVMVGQLSIEEADYEIENGIASVVARLNLSSEAQGVIRVTVFDASVAPVRAIAERLVYREIDRRLQVNLSGKQPSYAPGSNVELQVAVTDENGSPQEAALGVSVVDESILNLANDKSTRLPTYFHLLTDIESPQDLEDANFYLSSEEGAQQALDLLLGTQGWRRFVELPAEQLVARLDKQDFGFAGARATWAIAPPETLIAFGDDLPFVAEHESITQAVVSQPASLPIPSKTENSSAGMILVIGGAALLLLLAVIGKTGTGLSFRVWGPAGALAAVALVVGLISAPTSSPRVVSSNNMADEAAAVETLVEPAPEPVEAADTFDDMLFSRGGVEQAVAGQGKQRQVELPLSESAGVSSAMKLPAADAVSTDSLAEVAPALPAPAEPAAESAPAQAMPAPTTAAPTKPAPPKAAPALAAPETPPDPASRPLSGHRRVERMKRFRLDDMDPELAGKAFEQRLLQRDLAVATEKVVVRDYAEFFLRPTGATSAKPKATILWQPYLKLPASGTAPVAFDLPRRAAAYRVIVEAHSAGRLGSAETLVVSQPEE